MMNKIKSLGTIPRIGLLALVLVVFMVAASAGNFNVPSLLKKATGGLGQDGLPGTEEFGLTKRQLVQSIEKVEALIAQCMADNGFKYVAADYKTIRRGMKADKSLPGMSEGQYIARHGFGISTMYTGKPPQLAAATTPAKIGLGQQNVRIFQNLSPADQVAYTRTLLGENVDATFAVAIEIEDFSSTGGCTRKAIEQVFEPDQLKATYVHPLDKMVYRDPRVVKALTKFTECMSDAGFNYTNPDDVEKDIRKRLYEITGGLPLEKLSPEAKAALAKLQAEERVVSVATHRCENKYVDPAEARVERELYGRPPK